MIKIAVAACAALLAVNLASAQVPRSGVRLVVPIAAAGPVDLTARVLAEGMSKNLGVPVIVENRPGANGAIAGVAVKNAPPDGATLLFANSSMLVISPFMENLPYDVATDFTVLAPVSQFDGIFAVGAHLGVKNMKEFVELARRSNPPLAIGSFGVGNISQAWIELLKQSANVNLLHVPYKGAAPALQEVLAGRIAGSFPAMLIAAPHVKSGKLVLLGGLGKARGPLTPDLPTLEELGYPGVDILPWLALLGPRQMPANVVSAIRTSAAAALRSDETRKKLIAAGITPWLISPEELGTAIAAERERWRTLILEKKVFGEIAKK
jgi:tripartite-type tricarboxylate transporter receptor subunit TctC